MARLVVRFAALLIALAAARAVNASQRAFAVAWSAPAECPDAAAIGQYVDDVLGYADAGPVAVRAVGSVTRSADSIYAVTLDLDAGAAQPSKRSLSGADCESVSRAAALLIGLAVRARVEPPPAPLPPPLAPAPAAAPVTHARAFVSLLVLADDGSTPKPTLGVGVAGGVRWSHLRLEPMVGYFAPRSTSIASHPDVGAQFQLATAGARACSPFSADSVWLAPCLGAGVDWLRARGFGARSNRSASSWALVARGGVLAGWDISPIISAHVELEAALPVARPEFMVDGDGDVYRRSPLAARAALGLDVHF